MSELTWTIGSALASALLVLGISLSIGSLGLTWLVRGHAPTEIAPRVGRIVVGAALAVLGATMLRAVLQSAALADVPSAWMTMVQPVLFDTELGFALRLQASAALILLAAQSLLTRTRSLAVVLSVASVALLGIAPGLGGHPAAHDFPRLALAVSFVHVGGVGLWLGTLALLTLISKRLPDAALATALRRFHRIAAIGVVSVVGTGVAKLVDLQPPLALLSDSTWGVALIAKLGAFMLVAVLGLKHWRGADAALAAGERGALLRSFALELGTALIVLACTAVLINSSPPERASLATGNSTFIF